MYNLGFVATHDNGLFDKQLAIAMVRCKVWILTSNVVV
jgi:hypothetical protein